MTRRRWPFALAAALLASSLVLAQDSGMLAGASLDDTPTTPLTIFGSKLTAWYRPDNGYVSVDGSNNVTQLNDRSGNGYHLNVVGGTPVWTTDAGDPAIDFESTESDALGRAVAPLTDEPMAFYCVCRMEDNLATGRTLAAISTAASASGYWALRIAASEAAQMTVNDGATSAATHGSTLSLATRYVLFGEASANNARRVNVNGGTEVTETTNRPGAVTPDYISVGAHRVSGAWAAFHDGLIYEVVVLNAVPTAGQNTSYLAYTTDRFSTP